MIIAEVAGHVVATKKDDRLTGKKLLVLHPHNGEAYDRGRPMVAIDGVGAGIGEVVLVVTGSSAREMCDAPGTPVDAAVVGIIDTVEIMG